MANKTLKTPSRPRRSTPTPGAAGRLGRTPTTGSRFGRSTPAPSGGRFGLSAPSAPKRPTRSPNVKPKGKGKGKSGAKGGLAGLLSSLPAAAGKKASPKGVASKAKPALALVAAGAGAILGRKQLQKRKEDDVVPVTTHPVTPVEHTPSGLNDTSHEGGTPRPLDTTSPDAI